MLVFIVRMGVKNHGFVAREEACKPVMGGEENCFRGYPMTEGFL